MKYVFFILYGLGFLICGSFVLYNLYKKPLDKQFLQFVYVICGIVSVMLGFMMVIMPFIDKSF